MLHLLSNIFRKNEQRTTSTELSSSSFSSSWLGKAQARLGFALAPQRQFEDAVNHALTADTVADSVSKPYISEEGALNLSAVWACVRILSETVGTLPVHLYRRTAQGRERQYTHPCRRLLQQPNSYSNRFDLMHHLMVSTALWGNGYEKIIFAINSKGLGGQRQSNHLQVGELGHHTAAENISLTIDHFLSKRLYLFQNFDEICLQVVHTL